MIKKALVAITASLFTFLLFSTATTYGFSRTFTAPHIKSWPSASNIYRDIVPSALEQTKQDDAINTDTTSIPLTDQGVKDAVNKSFPPSLLQSSSETAIDSIFQWLNGTTKTPDFKLDMSGAKMNLATNIADYLKTRYAGLPLCAKGQLPGSSDIFQISCRPAVGFDINTAVANATKDIATSKDFLADPVITADNFKNGVSSSTPNQTTFFQSHANIPKAYQWLVRAPIIGGILALLCAAMVFFLSQDRRHGLRKLAISLVIVGILLFVASVGLHRISSTIDHQVTSSTGPANAALKKDINTLAKAGIRDVSSNFELIASIYLVTGMAGVGYLLFTRHSKSDVPV